MAPMLDMNAGRMLLAFYSRSGTTRKVAEKLEQVLGCDVEEIFDSKRRSGVWGFIVSGFDATFSKLTVIRPVEHDPSAYDLVIVGSPAWNRSVSAPIRTYLTQYKNGLKDVAFFYTGGDLRNKKVFQQMEDICGKRPVGLLALTEFEVNQGKYDSKVREFAKELRAKPA
jgi:flavodoxin